MEQTLPSALQRQIDEAEALEQQLMQQQAEGEKPEAPAPVDEVAQVEVESTPEAQTPEVVPPQQSNPDHDAGYWKARFETVSGMAAAQGKQLSETIKQVQALTSELDAMKAKKDEPKTEEVKPAVTDKDVETFGSDLIELQERIAKKAVADARAEFRGVIEQQAAYIKQLENQVGNVNQQVTATAQDRFYEALTRQVPDWEQVNVDHGFINWLAEVDPLTGVARQTYLDDAANRHDLGRVSAIFNTYKQVSGKVQQQVQTQAKQTELERQVAPSKSRSGAAPVATDQKIWSGAEYQAVYDPRHVAKRTPDEQNALEAEADRAAAEGRIQW